MAEIGYECTTPGPVYKVIDHGVTKKRALSIKFDSLKTSRLDPIKRTENQDFYETGAAAVKMSSNRKAPAVGFLKSPKRSFAEEAAKRHKSPGVGTYKISDKCISMLSPSPGARKR